MRTIGLALTVVSVMAVAVSASVELHYFWSRGCPECAVMSTFLEGLQERYPELEIRRHEVLYDSDNWRLMKGMADAYNKDTTRVPMVFVGDEATVGVGANVELVIEEEVARCLEVGCPSPMERVGEVRWRPSPLELALAAGVVVVVLLILLDLSE